MGRLPENDSGKDTLAVATAPADPASRADADLCWASLAEAVRLLIAASRTTANPADRDAVQEHDYA